jgi:hypothetical protein
MLAMSAAFVEGYAARYVASRVGAHQAARTTSVRLTADRFDSEKRDLSTTLLLDAVESWVREQRVSDVVPEPKLRSFLKAVRSDVTFWERQYPQYEKLWHNIETQIRRDKRPLKEILGKELTEDVLKTLETYNTAPAINRVLQSDAIERLIGSVLYEALFAFIKSVDIIGQLMSNLPFFGPMRDQIMNQSKKQIDTLMGDQISQFLGSYTKEAVRTATKYVDSNKADFGRAQRRLAEDLLIKPLNDLLPPPGETALVRDTLWLRVRELRAPNEDDIISALYAQFGDETIDALLPLQDPRVATDQPAHIYVKSRELLRGNLYSFITSEQGRGCLDALAKLQAGGPPPEAASGRQGVTAVLDAAPKPSTPDDWD